MTALPDKPSPVQDQDVVDITDRVQPMGDNDQGFVLNKIVNRVLDDDFVFRINIGSRLVQQNNRRIFQDCPG